MRNLIIAIVAYTVCSTCLIFAFRSGVVRAISIDLFLVTITGIVLAYEVSIYKMKGGN